ncbi:hypothetical protein RE628_23205 [Paenibacillus sp. D2_2]|uniref:DUF6199 family natural product biosynthesis protein n=1 Tax=Paenibacillus sp. D2_2 TaxID=3073092 RepID=UPI0028160570|nr:DUF6199 family natural product biosynthesis protein [Paenibacillus sp. D2_2]WMT40158.1 hypothetical protein RE628_23205 [Paenibacillus sp. D2_2]
MTVLIAVLCVILGAISVIFPGPIWYLSYGWRYRDMDPSRAALMTQRVGGILLSLIGFIMIAV